MTESRINEFGHREFLIDGEWLVPRLGPGYREKFGLDPKPTVPEIKCDEPVNDSVCVADNTKTSEQEDSVVLLKEPILVRSRSSAFYPLSPSTSTKPLLKITKRPKKMNSIK